MTKEKIREEMAKWQHQFNQDFYLTRWEELTDLDRDMFRVQADALSCRLSPFGVVIKVEGEDVVTIPRWIFEDLTKGLTHIEIKPKAGYVAVEPLI